MLTNDRTASGFQSGTVDVNQQWSSIVRGVAGHGSLGGGMPIRIMYIGASMTLGEHSEGERGYREQIRDWITEKGNPINCVGAVRLSPSTYSRSRSTSMLLFS